VKFTVQRK